MFNGNKTIGFIFADNADCSLTLSSFIISERGAFLYQLFCQQWEINDWADTWRVSREWTLLLPHKRPLWPQEQTQTLLFLKWFNPRPFPFRYLLPWFQALYAAASSHPHFVIHEPHAANMSTSQSTCSLANRQVWIYHAPAPCSLGLCVNYMGSHIGHFWEWWDFMERGR